MTIDLPRPPRWPGMRVRIGGRAGEIATFRMAHRAEDTTAWRYSVTLDDGLALPDVGEEMFDRSG